MSLNPTTKRPFMRGAALGRWPLGPRKCWLLVELPAPSRLFVPFSWRPPPSLGHVYWRCLFPVSPFSRLQDTDGTKRVVTDHQWSWLFRDYGCHGDQPCWTRHRKHELNGWVNTPDKTWVMQLFAEPLAGFFFFFFWIVPRISPYSSIPNEKF